MKSLNSLRLVLVPIFLVLLYGFLISFLSRFYFWYSFSDKFNWVDIVLTFVHGLRFDLAALIYLNLIFFCLMNFKAINKRNAFYYLWAFFFMFYTIILVARNIYYALYGAELNKEFLTAALNGVTLKSIVAVMSTYFFLFILCILLFLVHLYVLKKIFFTLTHFYKCRIEPKFLILNVFVILVLSILSLRGGLQGRVLGIPHTWIYAKGHSFLALQTSNPLHNLIRSKKSSRNIPEEFLKQPKLSLSKYQIKPSPLNKIPKNILIIFVESLSGHAFDNSYMPHFKKWANKNKKDMFVTTQFYANGMLSKDAVVTSLYGIPSYFDVHLFESEFATNKLYGLGYWTDKFKMENFFIHGASYGAQHFDVIAKAAKFNYISANDNYSGGKDLRSHFGVHDSVLYQFSLDYINKLKKPFAGVLFTTSSHAPYVGTPNNINGSGDIEKDYELSLNYADQEITAFLNQATSSDWFDDTLFIITGDHSPPLSADWIREKKEFSRVPLLMYFKDSDLGSVKANKIGRHIDLPKTLFHLMEQYPDHWPSYGDSLLEKSCTTNHYCSPKTFFTKGEDIFYINDSGEVRNKSLYSLLQSTSSEIINEHDKDKEFKKIKSHLHDYFYRLKTNSLYD